MGVRERKGAFHCPGPSARSLADRVWAPHAWPPVEGSEPGQMAPFLDSLLLGPPHIALCLGSARPAPHSPPTRHISSGSRKTGLEKAFGCSSGPGPAVTTVCPLPRPASTSPLHPLVFMAVVSVHISPSLLPLSGDPGASLGLAWNRPLNAPPWSCCAPGEPAPGGGTHRPCGPAWRRRRCP